MVVCKETRIPGIWAGVGMPSARDGEVEVLVGMIVGAVEPLASGTRSRRPSSNPPAPLCADGLGRKASLIISTLTMTLTSCAEVVAIVAHWPELMLAGRLVGNVQQS